MADFAACAVRFRGPAGQACGTGFLIDRSHVLTCAHVVNVALGADLRATARPDRPVRVDLPFARAMDLEASVIAWHPPVDYATRDKQPLADIAVLRLAVDPPASAVVARLARGRPRWGREFRTFGFPVENGQPADGEISGEDTGGWVHLRPTKNYGHLLKEGFSGAPIFATDDNNDNTVLGMVVATQKGDESRVAYGLSLPLLRRAWPPMARPYKGLARFDTADADIFFGRETIVSELLVRTERDAITVVVGRPAGASRPSSTPAYCRSWTRRNGALPIFVREPSRSRISPGRLPSSWSHRPVRTR